MTTEELSEIPAGGAKAPSSKTWVTLVVIGCIVTVAAWVSMMADPDVSLWCAVAGLCLSLAAAIGVGKGLWRDLAITCTIACAVLLLVYGIFYYGLAYVIKSLG